MRLAYAMLADAAEISSSGKLSMIGGDFDTIPAPVFPALHPRITIVLKLLLQPEDFRGEHQLHVEIVAPDGLNLLPGGTQPLTLSPKSPEPRSPGKDEKFLLAITIPVVMFPMPGRYEVRLLVDDTPLGTLPLDLIEQPA